MSEKQAIIGQGQELFLWWTRKIKHLQSNCDSCKQGGFGFEHTIFLSGNKWEEGINISVVLAWRWLRPGIFSTCTLSATQDLAVPLANLQVCKPPSLQQRDVPSNPPSEVKCVLHHRVHFGNWVEKGRWDLVLFLGFLGCSLSPAPHFNAAEEISF